MKRAFVFLMLLICFLLPSSCERGWRKYQTEFYNLFDTVTVVTGYARNQAEFDRYAGIIYDRMEELHKLYDIYHEYDGLSNLRTVNNNAGAAPVEVSRDVIGLLLFMREGYELSGGAVNIMLGPVLQIWRRCREAGLADPEGAALPSMEALRKAAEKTDISGLVIDEAAGTVYLKEAGMSLDVGSAAKAYAAGLAVRAAGEAGMTSALINTGGNIVPLGKPLDGRDKWEIGIPDPDMAGAGGRYLSDTVLTDGPAVSCSGNYQRFYTVDGRVYGHIIDPETLMPAARYKQVVAVHEDPGLADLLSTVLFILPYEQGAALAERCGAKAFWIEADGTPHRAG